MGDDTGIVAVDPTACPDCGAPLEGVEVHQPALLRHAGYGATQRDRTRHCPTCGWHLHTETQETRP